MEDNQTGVGNALPGVPSQDGTTGQAVTTESSDAKVFTATPSPIRAGGIVPRRRFQRCFTDEDAPGPLSAILAVTAVLGLRIGETLALRVSDVDFTRRIIMVRQSVECCHP